MDRPIIFSAPMVRALLADRKTQTRRLATSPLRRVEAGDQLYVRESFLIGAGEQPIYRANWRADAIARGFSNVPADDEGLRWTPSIHMPRSASRLTLIVDNVRIEPLQSISRSDAIAEGLSLASNMLEEFWRWPEPHHENLWLSPPAAYRHLWNSLHDEAGKRWEDNPDVVALTFRVIRGNIDRGAS